MHFKAFITLFTIHFRVVMKTMFRPEAVFDSRKRIMIHENGCCRFLNDFINFCISKLSHKMKNDIQNLLFTQKIDYILK